ncbi:hypothetical protein FOCC_FOCC002694 [Frankliniella occidentalis]|nr:hypothetical protein FOCC_FOCC002694 [Frankliniella occidentalis]
MSAGAVARLAKPKLRGHFNDHLNKTFLYSSLGGAISAVGYYYLVLVKHSNRRDKIMAESNPQKEFERLRDLGFFWSVPPKDKSKALYDWTNEKADDLKR